MENNIETYIRSWFKYPYFYCCTSRAKTTECQLRILIIPVLLDPCLTLQHGNVSDLDENFHTGPGLRFEVYRTLNPKLVLSAS